jgi:hypothetical protein
MKLSFMKLLAVVRFSLTLGFIYAKGGTQYEIDLKELELHIGSKYWTNEEVKIMFIEFCKKHDSKMELTGTCNLKTLITRKRGIVYIPDQLESVRNY